MMKSSTSPVRVVRDAMATRFEVLLLEGDAVRLQAAGEEALEEVARVEDRLSLFRPHSDIGRLNAAAGRGWVQVSPDTFRLLERARTLTRETGGAFDPTASPMVRAWGFTRGGGRRPSAGELDKARSGCGWDQLEFDPEDFRLRILSPDGCLDLGAIGKGHALDRAVECLRDAGITNALIHGGTSSIVSLGPGPNGSGWHIGLPSPEGSTEGEDSKMVLRDTSLGLSATWGKSFESDGQLLGHVIDPRLGHPVAGNRFATVSGPSAAVTDALSTALLVLGPDHAGRLEGQFPGYHVVRIS
jgi:thiamine biosynthesis lipoprotein